MVFRDLKVDGVITEVSPLEEEVTRIKILPYDDDQINSAAIVFFKTLPEQYKGKVVNYQEVSGGAYLTQYLTGVGFREIAVTPVSRVESFRNVQREKYIPPAEIQLR